MLSVPLPKGIDKAVALPGPSNVPGVLTRLEEIQATFRGEGDPLADASRPLDFKAAISDLKEHGRDGVVCFNHLYRVITADINEKIQGGKFFRNNNFLTQFDVIFADRYLDAIRRYANPAEYGSAPACWRLLFEYRKYRDIHPMQFAICGVACHVLFDLPIATVQVCKNMSMSLDDDTHVDFQKINTIFNEKIPELRKHYEDKSERAFDRSIVKRIANRVCDSIVLLSRDLAWQHAKELWQVWDPPGNGKSTRNMDDLDNRTSYIARVILWAPLYALDAKTILNAPPHLIRGGLDVLGHALRGGI
jgi:Family of unknown function (DUF5995)